ncbi:MAG: hypothetical protein FJ290_16815 [Planctomycetes bacterium]|nr:hypothetical protein [Planctomycetota bacterium]
MWRSALSWLLGIDRGEIADGTGVRLKFAALWPTWVILLFAAAAIWLVAWLYSREKGTASRRRKVALAVLRCLLVGLVLLVLFKPILSVEKSEFKEAYVVALLDDSLSMRLRDRYGEPKLRAALARLAGLDEAKLDEASRADLVNGVLANPSLDLLGRIGKECKLRVATFAGDVRGVDPRFVVRPSGRIRQEPPKGRTTNREEPPKGRTTNREEPPKGGTTNALVTPQGDRTLLGAALRELADGLRGHRIAAAIVLTDGRTQDVEPTAVEVAKRLAAIHGESFPVFTVGVGAVEEAKDIEVVKILAPTAVKKDDQVTFNAVIAAKGFEGEVDVLLKADGKLVRTVRTRLEGGEPQTVALRYTPEAAGTFRFSVEVPPEQGELSTENNAARHILTVKDARTKVLFVAGQPSYFYRFLKNALVVDKSILLSCWLQTADSDFIQEGSRRITHYPETRQELFEFDVVVFSDVDPAAFRPEQLADLRAFVGQFGGGFIFVAGQFHPPEAWKGTPVEELLPVATGGVTATGDLLASRTLKEAFRARLTEQGRAHGIAQLADTPEESQKVWEGFPGTYWYHPVARAKPGGVVLAEHPYDRDERGPMPLIVVGRYDPGRTLYCGLDGTWRWRFWVGDVHFGRFWVQAINYVGTYRILGGSRRIQLATDKRSYALGERVVVQAQCLDDAFRPLQAESVEAKLEPAGAPAQTVRLLPSRQGPGIFEGSFVAARPGSTVLSVALGTEQESQSFDVHLPDTEFQHPTMDARTLREIAEATRGAFLRLDEAERLPGLIQSAGQEITTEIQDPVFDAPLVIILFLGLVCSEWWFRKRGMLA